MSRIWSFVNLFVCMITLFGCTQPNNIKGTHINKDNFIFAIKKNDTLSLDKYYLKNNLSTDTKPVVIFAFGGGFKGGDKARKEYIPFFDFLVQQGFIVVSIDYRTMLKDTNASLTSSPLDFVNLLRGAIDTAVVDLYDATKFVVQHQKDWHIDPDKIISCGSSAGAITVLQAEYALCNTQEIAKRAPADFHYAGVISLAGAIYDQDSIHWEKCPCPIMMFHGDADNIVPFEQATMDKLGGLWGSFTLAKSLDSIQSSFRFHQIKNADHEISERPLSSEQFDIMEFLIRQVLNKESLSIRVYESIPGDTTRAKKLTIQDYLSNNLR